MYENLTQRFCKNCEAKTGHSTFTEGRIHVCAICGTEIEFKSGEKGPPPQQPKPVPYLPGYDLKTKTEEIKIMARKYLTDDQRAEIKRRVDEASEDEKGAVRKTLAEEMGVTYNCILVNSKGGASKPAKVKSVEEPKSRRAEEPKSTGSIRDAVARMVAEQVDAHLADLDTRIEQVVARLFK